MKKITEEEILAQLEIMMRQGHPMFECDAEMYERELREVWPSLIPILGGYFQLEVDPTNPARILAAGQSKVPAAVISSIITIVAVLLFRVLRNQEQEADLPPMFDVPESVEG